MQKKGWIILSSALAACLIFVGTLSYTYARRTHSAENTLRILYENASLSAIGHLSDLKWHIDKALLSQDTGASAQLLSQVSSGAAGVRQSIVLLPIPDDGSNAALKFANQLEDYATMLEGQVDEGVTEAQLATLEKLSLACENLMSALTDARSTWDRDQTGIADRSLMDESVAYPTLIYDGPFSDAQTEAAAVMLQSFPEITREEALQKGRAFLGNRAASVTPGTDSFGPIPCYGVTAQVDGIPVQLAVTRQGGKILWMFPEHGGFDMRLTVEECRKNALQFLETHGYMDMEPLHFEVYEGLAVINFAATQGSVLLYPDQVKVQIRMDTGEVMGIECRSYLTHHKPRGDLMASVSQEEAQGMLSDKLTLTGDARLCVIPLNDGEALCYEFAGTYRDEQYLIYINARTGAQEEILKIVETQSGIRAV